MCRQLAVARCGSDNESWWLQHRHSVFLEAAVMCRSSEGGEMSSYTVKAKVVCVELVVVSVVLITTVVVAKV